MQRARRVEAYMLAWFLIELAILASLANALALPFWIPRSLIIVRILDIFQQSVNMSVFDQLRTDEKLVISSAVRTLVLSFLNYVVLIVCFGILYTTFPNTLIGSHSWFDDIYFSVATQLTIGYGDIRPIGWVSVVCVSQGIISVACTILILGRIVSVLPKIDSVMRQTGESGVGSRESPD